jgi:Cu+-exporting ATPase
MLAFLADSHRRHLLLTLAVGAGLLAYVSGAVRLVYEFDLAMLLSLIGGYPTYAGALSGLLHRKITADLAVALAAMAALWMGWHAQDSSPWFLVAAEVIFIMLVGESLEDLAIGRTRSGIAALLALRPHTARVRRGDHEHEVHVPDVRPDDIVIVRPGERVPIDGQVVRGASWIDQSPITGESVPVEKRPGDEVFAGTLNTHGALDLAVQRLGRDTTLERVIHLVEHAEESKAPVERLADRYAGYFVPAVLAAAAITLWCTRDVSRSVAVLVVACPCALVLATPTAVAAGIGFLIRRGILVKGGAVIENLGRLKCVVFDKTGTLTLARLRIEQIETATGYTEAAAIALAAAVERSSEHPIARLIVERANEEGGQLPAAERFLSHPGLGAEAVVGGQTVRVGSPRAVEEAGAHIPHDLRARMEAMQASGNTIVVVAANETAVAAIGIQDTIRPEAFDAVHELKHLGISRIVMLTGDHEAAARAVTSQLEIREFHSGLLPTEKAEWIKKLRATATPVLMVGDGVNDAPALVSADVGAALADIGSDVTVESAGLVLIGDDLRKLLEAIDCGRRVLRTIRQNIIGFAIVFNLLCVAAASSGWISPVTAAVLHQVSSLTVVLNSLRLLIDFHAWQHRLGDAWYEIKRRRRKLLAAAAIAALAVYVGSGLHAIGVGELGIVQRFGRRVLPLEQPGLHYRLPWPFAWHVVIRPDDLRRVEIGFRSAPGESQEPAAYEWNLQHRGGRYVARAEESYVWTGDENLMDVNWIVHYRVTDPEAAVFAVGIDGDGESKWDQLVRAAAETAFHTEMARRKADDLFTAARGEIAADVVHRTNQSLGRYGAGLEVAEVCFGDIHPPLEVVPAFRDVSSSLEEKEAAINDAQAYQVQTEAAARGQAAERIAAAEGLAADRTERATGAAARFLAVAAAVAESPGVARTRLYLQTVETALAGRRKVILDPAHGGRRALYLGRKGIDAAQLPSPAVLDAPVDNSGNKGTAP